MSGNIDAFTIVFQPGGVSTVFSVPAEVLTNEDFEGEAVLGRGLGELLRRLGDVSSFADRARVADTYLYAKRPALNSISGITKRDWGVSHPRQLYLSRASHRMIRAREILTRVRQLLSHTAAFAFDLGTAFDPKAPVVTDRPAPRSPNGVGFGFHINEGG